jgi:two-component system LytT family sensor kinase
LHLAAARSPRRLRREIAILFAVWAVPATFMVLQMYATAMINQTPLPQPGALVPALVEWLVWVPFTPVIMGLARRYPVTWPPHPKAAAVHLVGIVAAAFLRGTVYASATFLVGRVVGPITLASYLWRISIAWMPMATLVWGAILAAGAALDYAHRLKEREVRDAALREQLARAELGELRARLQPHFLFNALHSVSALVRGGENAAAVRVVAELSDLLRDVISRDAPDMVRLRDDSPTDCASSGMSSRVSMRRSFRRSSFSRSWRTRCATRCRCPRPPGGCALPRDGRGMRWRSM